MTLNWQFVLKARPSPNTVLVEIIIAFDELYNTLSSSKRGSASTGSSVFKKMFKENPDLDTNFETVSRVYEQYTLSHLLVGINEKELLEKFSKVK